MTASNSEARKRAEDSARRAKRYAEATAPGTKFFRVRAIYGAWTWTNYFSTADQAWQHLCENADEYGAIPEHAEITEHEIP